MNKIEQIIITTIKKSPLESKIDSVALFWSYIKNNNDKFNDIDILIELNSPVWFKLIHLERLLSEKIWKKVDLIVKEWISPYLINEVNNTKKTIYER